MEPRKQLIEDIRAAASGQPYFSASRVQDLLFDLYGVVDNDDAKRLVEFWLTLTIQRELFSGVELIEVLDELEQKLSSGVAS
ncbi:MAG TPA: hypothetical protein VFJ85_16670 [Acidimicrobiales bacterium]|nr:hypothetical protein [Acidimicrobiales bacterium]